MKYTVRVGGRTFEVEVSDLQARPIVATVEGQRFEVWPETATARPVPGPSTAVAGPGTSQPGLGASAAGTSPVAMPAPEPRRSRRTSGEAAAPGAQAGKAVYAPIPGVIESVAVQPGEAVHVGQALCILEAMKMKNVIRASREGTIARIDVVPGQHVKHNDVLMEYGDSQVTP